MYSSGMYALPGTSTRTDLGDQSLRALQFIHFACKKLLEKPVPDRVYMTVLTGAKKLSPSPDLEVPHCHMPARTQLCIALDGLEPSPALLLQFCPSAGCEQVAVRLMVAPADPPL
ncbi:MAG: hypothetical protein MZV70_33375 [Desulfobacterales bacterium]|nr:hypothetical protein [Desulfobacterales bacterium]